MKKPLGILKGVLCATLLFMPAVLPATSFAQDKNNTNDNTGVKHDVKDAGHSTKEAAKKTGGIIKRTTKKVVHKSAQKTSQGADKVAGKTTPKQ